MFPDYTLTEVRTVLLTLIHLKEFSPGKPIVSILKSIRIDNPITLDKYLEGIDRSNPFMDDDPACRKMLLRAIEEEFYQEPLGRPSFEINENFS